MRPLELLVALATAAFIIWRIAAYQRALVRRRDAITAVWTALDPDEGGPMSTIANTLEMERGARKRLTITGLDRRRNAVDLEALILSVVGAAVVRVDEETDPAFPDSFIVTALQDGECDLELLCDARPGSGSVELRDRRHVIVRSPDAIATKWNEVDLEDPPPAEGETGAGEQASGETGAGETSGEGSTGAGEGSTGGDGQSAEGAAGEQTGDTSGEGTGDTGTVDSQGGPTGDTENT